jgi:hypothetical protein
MAYERDATLFAPLPFRDAGWLARLLAGFGGPRGRKRVPPDWRDLPDHLKRDMGFLDGRRPFYDAGP